MTRFRSRRASWTGPAAEAVNVTIGITGSICVRGAAVGISVRRGWRWSIEAVDKIPELLEQLISDAKTTGQKIRDKVSYADEIAVAIGRAANLAIPRK